MEIYSGYICHITYNIHFSQCNILSRLLAQLAIYFLGKIHILPISARKKERDEQNLELHMVCTLMFLKALGTKQAFDK